MVRRETIATLASGVDLLAKVALLQAEAGRKHCPAAVKVMKTVCSSV